ncbi:P-loop containing nucleoside triphosphate hydrolase protein, partial [Syncephalis pseudoplumigaleata]
SSLFTANPTVPTRVDRWRADKAREATASTSSAISNGVLDDGTFAGLGLCHDLVQHLTDKMDIRRPTGVQRHMLQRQLQSNGTQQGDCDTILQSETGSGKTLAYLLPIVHELLEATPAMPYTATSGAAARAALRSLGTMACILTPTRELARQVYTVLERLLQYKSGNSGLRWIVPGLVSGGDKRQSEKARLRKGVTILVCTPGRLLDHLQNTQSFAVGQLRWVVLDEADRLLDLGFEDTLLTIIRLIKEPASDHGGDATVARLQAALRQRRQIVLCSATLQSNVRQLAGQSLTRPFDAKTANNDDDDDEDDAPAASLSGAAPKQLRQSYVVVPAKLRLVTLCAFLKSTLGVPGVRCEQRKHKVVIFLSCCASVDFIYKLLAET